MKKILIGIGIIIIIIIGGIMLFHKKPKKIENIKSFTFSYTENMSMYGYIRYTIECKDKCIQTVKKVNEEKVEEKEISKERVKELEDLLNKYKVSSWDGFNQSDHRVLDGRSFSMYIKLESEESVDAQGYMKWPKNFGEVREELKNFFE